ncbi:hypothetical protein [Streptomyces sp. NPDC059949]|uniref:hypothetical protein n=1 Tax=Streptomyces sp. NPDC059949 TaxID=3347013 RepID=UPI00364FF8F8
MTTPKHEPLRNPERAPRTWTPPLDMAVELARGTLVEQQAANIYDKQAMLTAAVRLEIVLSDLLAALDAKADR